MDIKTKPDEYMFEETIKKRVITATKKKIDQVIIKIIHELNKKTVIYAVWSLVGILLMILHPPKTVFVVLSFIIISFAVYLIIQSIKSLKLIVSFINHFDEEVKKRVEKEIQSQTEESLKNKLGLWLSGFNSKDIENLFISYAIRELARRFKKHKRIILSRIAAYTTAVLLFKEVILYMFI